MHPTSAGGDVVDDDAPEPDPDEPDAPPPAPSGPLTADLASAFIRKIVA